MRMGKLLLLLLLTCGVADAHGGVFFDDEPVQQGLNVIEMSHNFADMYESLDSVKWGGKSVGVAIESLEKLNPSAHIAATDERVVLVWGDSIVANYPRPDAGDWNAYGEITTALLLKLRAADETLGRMGADDIYRTVTDTLLHGIDEHGRYVPADADEITDSNRILTSAGIAGARDGRGNFRVSGVFKDSPADAAGIMPGDLISGINGKSVPEMDDDALSAAMNGFNSGTAKIHLLTPAGNRDVVLRRATVILADADIVHRAGGDGDGVLEFIVHNISNGAVSIINEALAKYPAPTGIVLDLRAATGDDERAAAKMAGLFIGAVPVMRVVETAMDEVEILPGGSAVTDAPVVVLTSDMTRGTAEAIAAAFYENRRGVLVGTPTAGAARIASRIGLKNGASLELLNKSIKTGTGRTIDGRGVFPIVCLSNIRSVSQQQAFFLNVINNDFNAVDFNAVDKLNPNDIRRGCPTITDGADEDALAAAVSAKILTDKRLYSGLLNQ